jgi:hypothetical protein
MQKVFTVLLCWILAATAVLVLALRRRGQPIRFRDVSYSLGGVLVTLPWVLELRPAARIACYGVAGVFMLPEVGRSLFRVRDAWKSSGGPRVDGPPPGR